MYVRVQGGRSVAVVVIVSLLAGACTTTGQPAPGGAVAVASTARMSPAAAALRQQQVEYSRIQEGTMTGAVVGGLLGAGVGALLGGRNRGSAALIGGLVGAGVGAAAGGTYARNVNQQTRTIAGEQSQYRAMIDKADRSIAHLRQLNETAARVVAEESANIASLNRRYHAGQITAAQYREDIAAAQGNLSALLNARSQIDSDLATLERAANSGSPEAQSRVAALRSEKARLEAQLSRLRDTYDRVPKDVGAGL